MAAVGYDVSNHPAYHRVGEDEDEGDPPPRDLAEADYNMTMFDLNIDSVDVTLSLKRWLDGKGLVEDAVVRGVRGVIGLCPFSSFHGPLSHQLKYRSSWCLLGPG